MVLAIIERQEDIQSKAPFNERYYVTKNFKNICDKLDVLLFPVVSMNNLDKVVSICDGLILTGNHNDINPKYYDEKPLAGLEYKVDDYPLDSKLIELFSSANKPIIGICGGMQAINVYFGGSLHQDIPNHRLNNNTHTASVEKNSFIYDVFRKNKIKINSHHHQAVNRVASGFDVTALSDDGIVEAIEKDNIIGVQWHPELENNIKFFECFVNKFIK